MEMASDWPSNAAGGLGGGSWPLIGATVDRGYVDGAGWHHVRIPEVQSE